MFGNSEWKKRVATSLRELESQIADLKRGEGELRSQNAKLSFMLKNLGRKIVARLPISLESLDKGLVYDLIFAEEIPAWSQATQQGYILDLRPAHETLKLMIPGAVNIPFEQLALRLDSIPKDHPLLLVCENGIKSVSASELLSSKGYMFLYVLKGGMALYREQVEGSAASLSEGRDSDRHDVDSESIATV